MYVDISPSADPQQAMAPGDTADRLRIAGAAGPWIVARSWSGAVRLQAAPAAQELARSLREHGLLVALTVVYLAAGRLLLVSIAASSGFSGDLYSGHFVAMTLVELPIFAAAYVVHAKFVRKPSDLLAYLRSALFERIFTWRRLCMALPVLLLMPMFGATFTYLKTLIPLIEPFGWDPAFARWDELLHGGRHPWEWLQPVLGHPHITWLINAAYHQLWMFVTYGVLLWQMFDTARPRLRMRYLLTFLLSWVVIGNVAATALASAGPVYFGRVTGLPDPFAPLMAYLHQAASVVPLPILDIQEMLWRAYTASGIAVVGGGISAMPSMHIATTFSFVLLGFARNRALGTVFAVFCFVMLIGSVHLGWHYAIDGYVAIIATWLIWLGVGWLLDRPAVVRLLWGGDTGPSDHPRAAVAGR